MNDKVCVVEVAAEKDALKEGASFNDDWEIAPSSNSRPSVTPSWKQRRNLADEELMSLLPDRDATAFAALYDRHSRVAYSLAYRMMGKRQEAEDLVQDAFLQVWRAAGSYRAERGSVRTWILSIVNYRGIDRLRSSASRRSLRDKAEAMTPTSQPSEALAETWRNSQCEQVRESLRGLPAEQLKVLELAYFSGHTHLEIAEMLGLPLGTVKGRMRLGMKKIREYFDFHELEIPR